MPTPVYANVMNTSKFMVMLKTPTDSVSVFPSHNISKVKYEFTTWSKLPAGIKIDSYIMSDGSIVKTLDTTKAE